jgi:hypothetical protein
VVNVAKIVAINPSSTIGAVNARILMPLVWAAIISLLDERRLSPMIVPSSKAKGKVTMIILGSRKIRSLAIGTRGELAAKISSG